MVLLIDARGDVFCVYGEEVELAAIGPPEIHRASSVEPDPHGRWWADLAPVDGPRLGPFARRTVALAAETQWLFEHWLPAAAVLTTEAAATK